MRKSNYFAVAAGLVISMPAYAHTKDPFPAAETKIPFNLAQSIAQKTTVEFPPCQSIPGSCVNTEAEPVPPKKTPTPTPTKKTK
jgi:hypothetical protein